MTTPVSLDAVRRAGGSGGAGTSAIPLTQLLGARAEQLKPKHLRTATELLEWESRCVLQARKWALPNRGRRSLQVATLSFLMQLHREIFADMWSWAGEFRKSEHPDGARWPTIGLELNEMLGQIHFWHERRLYPVDEVALRMHHKLIRIRPWEGGNGVHARLAADAFVWSRMLPPFTWGRFVERDPVRKREMYLAALRDADSGIMQPMRDFARG